MWSLLFSMHAQAAECIHPATPDVHFTVSLACGTLTFRGSAEPMVRVNGEFGDLKPSFEGSDKELRFTVPMEHMNSGRRSCDLTLDISMPKGGSLDASSVNGAVTVTGIRGVLVLDTVNGDISVIDPGSEIRATAVNGEIKVNDLKGEAELTTVNGDITLAAGDIHDLRTETVNGDTQIRSGKVRRLRSQTVQGDIVFAGALDAAARLDFESHAGDITVRVPSEPGYVLALESFSGDIENRANGVTAVRPEFGPGTHLDTTVGSGAAHIDAQSFSGDIVIEPPPK